jgi:hypothetical protein
MTDEPQTPSSYWDGYIYQPIVFDDAPSEAECQKIYDNGIGGTY